MLLDLLPISDLKEHWKNMRTGMEVPIPPMGGRGLLLFFKPFPVILAKNDPNIDLFGLILTVLRNLNLGGLPPALLYPNA